MSFRSVSSAVAILWLLLSLCLIFIPEIIYWLFAVQQDAVGDFLAKRAGVLFIGLSMLCFLARNSTTSEVQSIVSLVAGTTMGVMAVFGIYELARGYVGLGMLIAIFVEILISAFYFKHWKRLKDGIRGPA